MICATQKNAPPRPVAKHGRRQGYDATGGGYEQDRYGASHMRTYLAMRCEAIAALVGQIRQEDGVPHVLEVGCGTGLTLDHLSRLPGERRLFGLDFSRTMLCQARNKAVRAGTCSTFLQADATELPFADGTFDVVYGTRFIHQFTHARKRDAYQELLRVTRDGGLVVLEFYARGYHWLRYYLGGCKGRTRDSYFAHYPSKCQVRDIVGSRYRLVPLRIAGARLVQKVLGEQKTRRLTGLAGHLPLRILLDEYLVVTRK